MKTQTDHDKKYRARQADQGIVRKTVRVPAVCWPELQEICAAMRKEHTEGIKKPLPRRVSG